MFCESCGSSLPNNANFCVGCGSKVRILAPTAPTPEVHQPPPSAAAAIPDHAPFVYQPQAAAASPEPHKVQVATYAGTAAPESHGPVKCNWCGQMIETSQSSCPKCGAALGLSKTSKSGWAQLPGRKDMAKLNFSKSVCQIEGLYVPVADMKLDPSDSVYFTHNTLLWMDPTVKVAAMSMKGAWKRMMAGLPLVMTEARGPGHIAFSHDGAGELIALPLQAGQSIDVREHLFLVATHSVHYDWFQTNIWFRTRNGNETETHYPIGMMMDRFNCPAEPGLLLLHAAGNVRVRELGPQQTILIKPTALVFKDPTVQMALHYEQPASGMLAWGGSQTYLWLRLRGPGRIAVQSVFERIEGESAITGVPMNSLGGIGGAIGGDIVGSILDGLFDS